MERIAVLVLSATVAACNSFTPTTPSPTTQTTPPAPPAPPTTLPTPVGSPTVTITSTGFSPLEITVAVGAHVLFVNSDFRAHEIWGGIDHESRDCLEVEGVGLLVPGQIRQTGTFRAIETCRFHDHANVGNPAYQGRILVQ